VLLAELCLQGQFWEFPERLFYRRVHPGMSRKANPTLKQLAAWFDPKNTDALVTPMTKLLVEHFRGIRRTQLSAAEKRRCYAVVAREWTGRSRAIAAELGSAALQVLAGCIRR
jgi:hypothetical protein